MSDWDATKEVIKRKISIKSISDRELGRILGRSRNAVPRLLRRVNPPKRRDQIALLQDLLTMLEVSETDLPSPDPDVRRRWTMYGDFIDDLKNAKSPPLKTTEAMALYEMSFDDLMSYASNKIRARNAIEIASIKRCHSERAATVQNQMDSGTTRCADFNEERTKALMEFVVRGRPRAKDKVLLRKWESTIRTLVNYQVENNYIFQEDEQLILTRIFGRQRAVYVEEFTNPMSRDKKRFHYQHESLIDMVNVRQIIANNKYKQIILRELNADERAEHNFID